MTNIKIDGRRMVLPGKKSLACAIRAFPSLRVKARSFAGVLKDFEYFQTNNIVCIMGPNVSGNAVKSLISVNFVIWTLRGFKNRTQSEASSEAFWTSPANLLKNISDLKLYYIAFSVELKGRFSQSLCCLLI